MSELFRTINGLPVLRKLTRAERTELNKELGMVGNGPTVHYYEADGQRNFFQNCNLTAIPLRFLEPPLAPFNPSEGGRLDRLAVRTVVPPPVTPFPELDGAAPDVIDLNDMDDPDPVVLPAPPLRVVDPAPAAAPTYTVVTPQPKVGVDEVRLFDFKSDRVRVVAGPDGEPWFAASDVARILGYSNPRKAIIDHCKGGHESLLPSAGGPQLIKIIPERDVYRLVMRSRLPQAEEFEEWVVGVVLPSIRKTGSYQLKPVLPQTYLEALEELTQQVRLSQAKDLQIHTLGQRNQVLEPKGEAYDKVLVADGQSVRQVAQQLSNGLEDGKTVGQNGLFRWLRWVGYVIPGTTDVPYQKYLDDGLFTNQPQTWENEEGGEVHMTRKLLITGKGLLKIQEKFRIEDVPTPEADAAAMKAARHRNRTF